MRIEEPTGAWLWKSEQSLPDPTKYKDPDGKAAYIAQLQTRPVAETLAAIDRLVQTYPDVT